MARRRSDPTRLEAFSDAVFALSATLLVVSLEVPSTFDELIAELFNFGAFALSFAALVLIWSVHNAYFRRYGLQDGWTIALNGCLLFVVLFYVFPLKFVTTGFVGSILGIGNPERMPELASVSQLGTIYVLYSLGFVLIFTFVSLMYRHATRRAMELALNAVEVWEAHFLKRHYAIFVAVGLLSILLAWLEVGLAFGLPGLIYPVLGPLCWWHGAWSERRKPVV